MPVTEHPAAPRTTTATANAPVSVSPYPPVQQDLALIVDDAVPVGVADIGGVALEDLRPAGADVARGPGVRVDQHDRLVDVLGDVAEELLARAERVLRPPAREHRREVGILAA